MLDDLFTDIDADIDDEVDELLKRWESAMQISFHELKPSKSTVKGVDDELKEMLDARKSGLDVMS